MGIEESKDISVKKEKKSVNSCEEVMEVVKSIKRAKFYANKLAKKCNSCKEYANMMLYIELIERRVSPMEEEMKNLYRENNENKKELERLKDIVDVFLQKK